MNEYEQEKQLDQAIARDRATKALLQMATNQSWKRPVPFHDSINKPMSKKQPTWFCHHTEYQVMLKITPKGGLSVRIYRSDNGDPAERLAVTEYPKAAVKKLFDEWKRTKQ